MHIALLGFGLIGGSIARALAEERDEERDADRDTRAGHRVVAWTPGGDGPRRALEDGVIDAVAGDPRTAISGADLVVLAAPPLVCAELLRRLGGDLRPSLMPSATVTDVASTKGVLIRTAREEGVPYVGGHPMAGRETSGYRSADASLFQGRPWVITEPVAGGDPGKVRALALACGARPVEMEAGRHDRLVAAISHLPLLTSVALVEAITGAPGAVTEDWPEATALAASGWRDTTRLARGDVTMGAEIVVTNAEALALRLRAYRDRLDEWLAIIEDPDGPDPAVIRERLAAARSRLEG
ncbi:MAG: prephenate dehydrogenase/arogenate dehydrogenase family protein [Chloroflexi bacterium]|nr:prephenate dehydrogenase/arogenate dehydrogenase family protein [Chloroflexota bacterium]